MTTIGLIVLIKIPLVLVSDVLLSWSRCTGKGVMCRCFQCICLEMINFRREIKSITVLSRIWSYYVRTWSHLDFSTFSHRLDFFIWIALNKYDPLDIDLISTWYEMKLGVILSWICRIRIWIWKYGTWLCSRSVALPVLATGRGNGYFLLGSSWIERLHYSKIYVTKPMGHTHTKTAQIQDPFPLADYSLATRRSEVRRYTYLVHISVLASNPCRTCLRLM